MLESEKFAVAAHLHVLLRRTTGRVTDVEWMIRNTDYAREIIRVARAEEHVDLRKLADKLEAAVMAARPMAPAAPAPKDEPTRSPNGPASLPISGFGASSSFGSSGFEPPAGRKRYVGSLR